MSDTHKKLQYGNNYNHWKILDLVLDIFFSYPKPNRNQTHLPKHQTLSTDHQFSKRIWYVEYYSVHAHMAWSQEFRFTSAVVDKTASQISYHSAAACDDKRHSVVQR